MKILRLIAVVVRAGGAGGCARGRTRARPRASSEPQASKGHAAGEHGEGAGEHGAAANTEPRRSSGKTVRVRSCFNFAALLCLLIYFGRARPVKKALQARHEQIKTDLASAAESRAAAQARFEQQEKRLAALEQRDRRRSAPGIKQEAEAEKARLIAMAEDRARRIREESEFIIEQQVKQAEEDSAPRGRRARPSCWRRRSCARSSARSDQQRLIDSFVGDVAGNGACGRAARPRARAPSGPRRGAQERDLAMAVMGGSVARRYARALFGIGVDAGKFEALGDELGELATLWSESDELRQALENPVFKPSEKRAVLERILPQVAPTPEVQRFVLLLLDRRRIVLLPAIARAYRRSHRRARRPRARRGDLRRDADPGDAGPRAPLAGTAHGQEGDHAIPPSTPT